MKKTILTLILFAVTLSNLPAQQAAKIAIQNLSVTTEDDTVRVSFGASVDRKAAPSGATVLYAPVITDGRYRVSLPAIVVQGFRAAKVWERHEWAAGIRARPENGIYTKNGETVDYTAAVAFQPWMHDSFIELEAMTFQCCDTYAERMPLAGPVLPAPIPEPQPEPEPLPEPQPEPAVPELTTGEKLAQTFPFVLSAAEFDPNGPDRFYDDERDNALIVYYKINSYRIEKEYAGNEPTLDKIVAVIDILLESADCDVEHIVVAGFTSPEGSAAQNDKLAWERAVSVKEHILKNTGMADGRISLFNGSADWHGLRLLVEQDKRIPAREQILDIIDNHPVWNSTTQTGRVTMLRQLDGGRPYRYLAEHIFPKLRNGAFIRVYYKNK